jgi:hypothetical protein
MSEIKAGDLVMVVRATPCCSATPDVGSVFRVASINAVVSHCELCGQWNTDPKAWDVDDSGVRVSQCVRIDPPAQPESVETDREVVA